jgi:thiol-disulfide isomerase/thioredoxin
MHNITGKDQLNEFIWNNKDKKFIILYYGAPWCDPCLNFKKKINNLDFNDNYVICQIDIDDNENDELTDLYKIKFLPTCIFVSLDTNNKVVVKNRIDGYDWIKFKQVIDALSII